MPCEKASDSMKHHTGIVLFLALVCFQTKPGLSQEATFKGILKSQEIQWIQNSQPKLVLKNYLKMAKQVYEWLQIKF